MNAVHTHIPYSRVEEYLGHLRKNRLDLEIYFSSSSLDDLRPGDIDALRKKLNYNPSLSIHAPFMDLSPGAVDSRVRDITIERFSHIMDIAEVLLPKAIVFHSGYEKWKYAHRVDIWLEGSLKTWRPIIERASALGIKIAIENIFEDEPSNLKALMEELHSDSFGICFDTGHCNLFTKVPLRKWLMDLGTYVFELHLHDNDTTFDQHLPIGDGTFDFETLFTLLKGKDCLYTVEAHSPENVLRSIARLKEYTG
ncbi:MAG TPA: sugar phosphate isomerase/epimerase family protein [Thermodesulfovibrionales bacterium]|nr:sugar phosphate isomerase/epimerase family protein [Thermodesulfovibrionales bacterium]